MDEKDKSRAILFTSVAGIGVLGVIAYILYEDYKQTSQELKTLTHYIVLTEQKQQEEEPPSIQTPSQGYSVQVYNVCNYNVVVSYTDINGQQQEVELVPGMTVTLYVQPGSTLNATDIYGRPITQVKIQENSKLTFCIQNLFPSSGSGSGCP